MSNPNPYSSLRRLGLLFAISAMALLAAFGLVGATSDAAAASQTDVLDGRAVATKDSPEIKEIPLGTEEDCTARLSPDSDAAEYCSDLFLTVHDLDAYWKEQFPKLVTKNQKYVSPSGFDVGLSPDPKIACNDYGDVPGKNYGKADEYCGDPAHYDPRSTDVYMAESTLLEYHKLRGDFSPVLIIAHEWGHHIQQLLGAFDKGSLSLYTIRSELQADCYAGAWANYEDKKLDQLDPGDISEGSNLMFFFGDPRFVPWNEEGAHGVAEQRVLSFRVGYENGDPRVCAMWAGFEGRKQPLLNLDNYGLAIAPPDQFVKTEDGISVISSHDGISVLAVPLHKLGKGTAPSQFPEVFKTEEGSAGRALDIFLTQDLPNRGRLPQSEVDKATSYAQTFEATSDAKQYHGIAYLNVRSGGGDGIYIEVYSEGAAGKADFKPLAAELRFILQGLSVKAPGKFTFTAAPDVSEDGLPHEVDNSPAELTTPEGDTLDANFVLHDRAGRPH